jgi:hypothetical protein
VSVTTKTSLSALISALVLGLLADILLLRFDPWGINAFLFVLALVAGFFWLARRQEIPVSQEVIWLPVLACFFAAFIAWRDSAMLTFLNILAVLMLIAITALRRAEGRLSIAAVMEYPLGMVRSAFNSLTGVFRLVFKDIAWGEVGTDGWRKNSFIALRSVMIAIPLVALFWALFASADSIFSHYTGKLFDWDTQDVAADIGWALFWTWFSAGVLYVVLIAQQKPTDKEPKPGPALSIMEIAVPLALLNVLFLAFVIVQFRFFFGGAGYVHETIGMTYSEYARGGFFELMWVSLLVLPILLTAHALLPKEAPSAQRVFGWLATSLIVLLFVIMASAIQRMRLYVAWGGLTELRLYTSAFMGWLALIYMWFLATVLREKQERFAFGALTAGFAVLAILDFSNPDNLIARTNLARANAPQAFDTAYNTSLSADAIPALVEGLPRLNPEKRGLAAYYILSQWRPPKRQDWRSWNYGRSRAWRAVGKDLPGLQMVAKAPPQRPDTD